MDPQFANTKDTTPSTIWLDSVLALAGCSVEELERFGDRARVLRWYSAGEPVWMAAGSLKALVRTGKIHARADAEVDGLKRMLSGATR